MGQAASGEVSAPCHQAVGASSSWNAGSGTHTDRAKLQHGDGPTLSSTGVLSAGRPQSSISVPAPLPGPARPTAQSSHLPMAPSTSSKRSFQNMFDNQGALGNPQGNFGCVAEHAQTWCDSSGQGLTRQEAALKAIYDSMDQHRCAHVDSQGFAGEGLQNQRNMPTDAWALQSTAMRLGSFPPYAHAQAGAGAALPCKNASFNDSIKDVTHSSAEPCAKRVAREAGDAGWVTRFVDHARGTEWVERCVVRRDESDPIASEGCSMVRSAACVPFPDPGAISTTSINQFERSMSGAQNTERGRAGGGNSEGGVGGIGLDSVEGAASAALDHAGTSAGRVAEMAGEAADNEVKPLEAHAMQLLEGSHHDTYDDGMGAGSIRRKAWTLEEDTAILESVQQMGARWRVIASLLPGRSDDAVRNRWNRLQEQMREGTNHQQDSSGGADSFVPIQAAERRKEGYKCSKCGQPKRNHVCTMAHMPTATAKQRAAQARSGDDVVRVSWSREEDMTIRSCVQRVGPRWSLIAQQLRGRTEHAVRNRWHRLQTMEET